MTSRKVFPMHVDQIAKATAFRALHERQGTFVIPNPWDAGTARILAALGFEALATTSAGLAFSLGRRDAEAAISREETLENARAIVAATDLPVSADLEDGFGYRPEDAAETIRRAAEIGLVGGSIEDTTADPVRPLHELGRKSRVVLRDEGALAVDGPNLRLRLFRLSRGDRHTLWLRTGS
jgi:2-methylisocitrate lyase-like PEP mutase family enzyme